MMNIENKATASIRSATPSAPRKAQHSKPANQNIAAKPHRKTGKEVAGTNPDIPRAAKAPKAAKPAKAPPFDLDVSLNEIGAESVALLKEGKLTQFDPLVSDWSCQLRVLWLVDAKSRVDRLTPEDIRTLGLYRLLTITTDVQKDALGMSRSQTTGEKSLPEGWENLSKTKLMEALRTAKKDLSYKMVDYLKAEMERCGLPIGEGLQANIVTSWSGAPVRFAKFFTGYEAMMAVAGRNNVPVTVHVREFHRDGNKVQLAGSRLMTFHAPNGEYVSFERPASSADEPCLAFEMYTARIDGESTLDKACETIKTLGLKTVVLAIAAAHVQYPSDAKVRETKEKPSPFVDAAADQHAEIATKHDLGKSKYFDKKVFTKSILLDIEHTFAAMYSEVVAARDEATTMSGSVTVDVALCTTSNVVRVSPLCHA